MVLGDDDNDYLWVCRGTRQLGSLQLRLQVAASAKLIKCAPSLDGLHEYSRT